jgi:hypothetical protein
MDLILRPSGRNPPKEWELLLREHGPAETDYYHIAYVGSDMARDIVEAGACFYLFGDPDNGCTKPAHGRGVMDEVTDTDLLSRMNAITNWQVSRSVHPMTCGVDSSHPPLFPIVLGRKIVLRCCHCAYRQDDAPVLNPCARAHLSISAADGKRGAGGWRPVGIP